MKALKNIITRIAARAQNARLQRRAFNSQIITGGGSGQRQDLGRATVARHTLHPLDRTASDYIRAREWAQLYYKEWTARKIVDIPVGDMLRNRWTYNGLDEDQTKKVETELSRIGFHRALRQALKMERLVGGSIILIGIKGEEEDASKPLDIKALKKGDLTFANVIPRTKVSSYRYDVDPLSPTFGKPNEWTVWGKIVHKSRMLIFDGDPLTDNEVNDLGFVNRSFDGFGVSVLASIYDDIIRSVGSRQAAMQLIQRASVLLIQNASLQNMLAATGGDEALGKLQDMTDQMSMYAAAMIDGKNIALDQWSANFGSVPELLEKYLQIIAAASDIPAVRFLGEAPGGLNTSGNTSLENYYNAIAAYQQDRLLPQLDYFMEMLLPSLFNKAVDPRSVQINFAPLWNPSAAEESQTKANEMARIASAESAGLITRQEARAEINALGLMDDELAEDDDDPGVPPDENQETTEDVLKEYANGGKEKGDADTDGRAEQEQKRDKESPSGQAPEKR